MEKPGTTLERRSTAELEFDSKHVMAMAGISQRQIQWWDERGLVRPVQRGHKRYYSARQAALVLLVAELLPKGYTLPQCRKLKPHLVRELAKAAESSRVPLWIATDGKRVTMLENSLDELVNFQQLAPVTVIYLTPIFGMVGL